MENVPEAEELSEVEGVGDRVEVTQPDSVSEDVADIDILRLLDSVTVEQAVGVAEAHFDTVSLGEGENVAEELPVGLAVRHSVALPQPETDGDWELLTVPHTVEVPLTVKLPVGLDDTDKVEVTELELVQLPPAMLPVKDALELNEGLPLEEPDPLAELKGVREYDGERVDEPQLDTVLVLEAQVVRVGLLLWVPEKEAEDEAESEVPLRVPLPETLVTEVEESEGETLRVGDAEPEKDVDPEPDKKDETDADEEMEAKEDGEVDKDPVFDMLGSALCDARAVPDIELVGDTLEVKDRPLLNEADCELDTH